MAHHPLTHPAPGATVRPQIVVQSSSGKTANPGSACTTEPLPCGSADRVNYKQLSATTNTRMVTIPSGARTATFPLVICDDLMAAGETSMELYLSSATPEASSSVTGPYSVQALRVSIEDDGDGGTLAFSSPSFSSPEDAGEATVTVTRLGGASCETSVSVSTADGTALAEDGRYTVLSGEAVQFADLESAVTFTVPIADDSTPQWPNEYFQVSFSFLSGSGIMPAASSDTTPTTASVTLLDDGDAGIFKLVPTAVTVPESDNATQTLVVTRTAGAVGAVAVNVQGKDGTATLGSDYTVDNGTLSFADQATVGTVTFHVLDNNYYDPDIVFQVVLSDPTEPAKVDDTAGTTTVTISDDGDMTVAFSASSSSFSEGDGVVSLTATREGSPDALADAVTVDCAVLQGGTAKRGTSSSDMQDFITQPASSCALSFAGGETTATLGIEINDDDVYSGTQDAVFELRNPSAGSLEGPNAQARTTLTILDNGDAGSLQWHTATGTFTESSGEVGVTVVRAGGDSSLVTADVAAVSGTALSGQDFLTSTSSLSLDDREANTTFSVLLIDDDKLEEDKTFTLVLSNPGGGASLGSTTTFTGTIQDKGDTKVGFSTATVSVEEADTTVGVTVTRAGATDYDVYVDVTASLYGGSNPPTLGTDYTLPDAFSVGSTEAVMSDFHLPSGSTEASFTVTIIDNDAFSSTKDVPFALSNARKDTTGSSSISQMLDSSAKEVSLEILDDGDAGTVAFTTQAASVFEWQERIVLTVTRLGPSTSIATATARTGSAPSNSATSGSDFVGTKKGMTFREDVSSFTVPIPILDDGLPEAPDEAFQVTLSSGLGGMLVANGTVNVTIMDDGQDVGLGFASAAHTVPISTNGGYYTVTITRVGSTVPDVSAKFHTEDGSANSPEHYAGQATPAAVAMGSGDTFAKWPVQLMTDSTVDNNGQSFLAILTSLSGVTEPPFAAQPVVAAVDTYGNPVGDISAEYSFRNASDLTAGTFKLSYRGEETSALAYNAAAADVETALTALTTVESATVTRTDADDAFRFLVVLPIYDWTTVIPAAGAPSVLWKRDEVQRVVLRSPFSLASGTQIRLRAGSGAETGFIDIGGGTTATDIQTALNSADVLGSGAVAVSDDPEAGDEANVVGAWLVTFSGADYAGDQDALTALYNQPAMQSLFCNGTGGQFTMSVGSQSFSAAFDTTASALAAEIHEFGSGPVRVTYSTGTAACASGGVDIFIEFLATLNRVRPLQATEVTWTQPPVQVVTCTATGGSFALSFDGDVAPNIGFQAPADFLETHLARYWTAVDTVTVTYGAGNAACSSEGVAITIQFDKVQSDTATIADIVPDATNTLGDASGDGLFLGSESTAGSLTHDSSTAGARDDLQGGTISSTATETIPVDDTCRVRKQQTISCRANAGSFSVSLPSPATWPDQTLYSGDLAPKQAVDISAFATADELSDALSALAHLNLVLVDFTEGETTVCSRFASNLVTLTFERESWSLNQSDVENLSFNFDDLAFDPLNGDGTNDGLSNRDVTTVEVQSFQCRATSGALTLTFAGTEVISDVAATSTTDELKAKFESLDKVREVTVSYTSGSTMCGVETANTITVSFNDTLSDGPGEDGNLEEVLVDPSNGGTDPLTHDRRTLERQVVHCTETAHGGTVDFTVPTYSSGSATIGPFDPTALTAAQLEAAIRGDATLAAGGHEETTISAIGPDADPFCAADSLGWTVTFTSYTEEAPTALISAAADNVVTDDVQQFTCDLHKDYSRANLTLNGVLVTLDGATTIADAQTAVQGAWTSVPASALTLSGTAATVCDNTTGSVSVVNVSITLSSLSVTELQSLNSDGVLDGSDQVVPIVVSVEESSLEEVATTEESGTCEFDPPDDGTDYSVCESHCTGLAKADCDGYQATVDNQGNCKTNGNTVGICTYNVITVAASETVTVWTEDAAGYAHVEQGSVSPFRADYSLGVTFNMTQVQAWDFIELAVTNFTQSVAGVVNTTSGSIDASAVAGVDGGDCGALAPASPGDVAAGEHASVSVEELGPGVATCAACTAISPLHRDEPGAQVSVGMAAGDSSDDQSGSLSAAFATGLNPKSGTLSGTKATSLHSGHAQFSDLAIDTSGQGQGVTISGTVGGVSVSATSEPFSVAPPALTRLAFASAPLAPPSAANATFSVVVEVTDRDGTRQSDNTTEITATVIAGDASALIGTTTVQCSEGVATFSDLAFTRIVRGVILRFAATTTPYQVDLPPIDMLQPGAAASLSLQWTATQLVAGHVASEQPRVDVLDSSGALVWTDAGDTATATVAASSLDTSNLTLSGDSASIRVGSAQFASFWVNASEDATLPATVSLTFTVPGVGAVTSNTLDLVAAPAASGEMDENATCSTDPVASLQLTGVPSTARAGEVLGGDSDISVTLLDGTGTTTCDTDAPRFVVAMLSDATASAELRGNVTAQVSAGMANFTSLLIRERGTYHLRFEASVGVAETAGPLQVQAGTPTAIQFRQFPSGALGRTTPAVSPTDEAVLTIEDNRNIGQIAFLQSELSVVEGSNAILTITRTGRSSGTVIAEIQPNDGEGTATFKKEYTFPNPDNSFFAFEGGDILQTFTVLSVDDEVYVYPDEVAALKLVSSSETEVDPDRSDFQLTLLDDGDAGTLQFEVDHYNDTEGRTGTETLSTLTLSRVGRDRPSGNITVSYFTWDRNAEAGTDYVSTSGILSFGDGEHYKTIGVVVLDDAEFEFPDEELVAEIFDVRYLNESGVPSLQIGGPNVSTLTILDNGDAGTLGFGPRDSYVAEPGDGSVLTHAVTVTRTEATSPELTISYRTISGTAVEGEAFAAVSGTLTFAEGDLNHTIPLQIIDDNVFQYPDEVAHIELHDIRYNDMAVWSINIDPDNTTASITIKDDGDSGSLEFSPLEYSTMEVAGEVAYASLTVTRRGRAEPSGELQIQYATTDVTAVNGTNYETTAGQLTVAGNESRAVFTVPVLDHDAFVFPEQVFRVDLFDIRYRGENVYSLTIGADDRASVTIQDNGDYGPPAFVPHNYAEEEGANGTDVYVTLTVSRTDRASPSGAISVHYYTVAGTAAENDAYIPTSGDLVFADAQETATLTVTVLDDEAFQFPDEEFRVELASVSYRGEVVRQFFGENRSATVTILDNGDAGTLTFIPHEYFPMETPNGSLATFTVSRIGRSTFSNELVVTYESLDDSSFGTTARPKLFPYNTTENGTTVTRDPYEDDGEDPAYDYVPTSGQLTFPGGEFTRTFTMPIADDLEFQVPDEVVNLRLRDVRYKGQVISSLRLGDTRTATAQILDDGDAGTLTFDKSRYFVKEGEEAVVTVSRVGRDVPDGAISIKYRTRDSTATAASGAYPPVNGTLSFPTGVNNLTFPVSASDDLVFVWPNEEFGLELYDPLYGNVSTYSVRVDAVGNESVVEIGDNGDAGTVALSFQVPSNDTEEVNEITVIDGPSGEIQLSESATPSDVTTPHTLTATRLGSASGNVTVRYSTNFAHNDSTATSSEFEATSGTLVMEDAQETATFVVHTVNDVEFQCPDDVVVLSLSDYLYQGEEVPTMDIAVEDNLIRIIDDGDAGLLSFTTSALEISEINGQNATLTLTVTRRGRDSYATPVTVDFQTLSGTALANQAFLDSSGLLEFPPDQPQQELAVLILHDDVFAYPDEEFRVQLLNARYSPEGLNVSCTVQLEAPGGGGASKSVSAKVTVLDDGDAGEFSFVPWGYTIMEPDSLNGVEESLVEVTVTRTGRERPSQNVTVMFETVNGTATSPGDFVATTSALEFADGQTSGIIKIAVLDDLVWSYDVTLPGEERFNVTITSLLYRGEPNEWINTAYPDTAYVEILDNGDAGTFAFAPAQYTVAEENGASAYGTLTVTRSGRENPSGNLTILYQTVVDTADENDFVPMTSSVYFGDGETNKTIPVEIKHDDEFVFPDEQFFVELTGVVYQGLQVDNVVLGGNDSAKATITILDDGDAGTVMFGTLSYAQTEGGQVTATVTRVGRSDPQTTLTAAFTTQDDTATGGVDYVASSGVLTFSAGSNEQLVTLQLNDDDVFQSPDLEFAVELTDVLYEGQAHYAIPTDVDTTARVTLLDDGDSGTFSLVQKEYSTMEGNGSSTVQTLTVTRTGGISQAITVEYTAVAGTAGEGAFEAVTSNLTVGDQVTNATIAVTILDDEVWQHPDEYFTVRISDLYYKDSRPPTLTVGDPTATVTILDDGDAGTFAFLSESFWQEEGNGTEVPVTLTLTRFGRAHPSQNLTVDVLMDPTGTTAVEGTNFERAASPVLPFSDGQTLATFSLSILDTTAFEYPDLVIEMVLQNPRYGDESPDTLHVDLSRNTTLVTIKDDGDAGTLQWSSSSYSATEEDEGGETTAVITVTRVGRVAPSGELTVEYRTLATGTATAGEDYTAVPGTQLTFGDGVTSQTAEIKLLGDDVFEFPDENVPVELYSALYNGLDLYSTRIGEPDTTDVVIVDNGDAGTLQFSPFAYEVTEGNGQNTTVTLSVTRMGGRSKGITVQYGTRGRNLTDFNGLTATQGLDFSAEDGSVTLADQVVNTTLVVTVFDDDLFEWGDENFTVALGEVLYQGANVPSLGVREGFEVATVTIRDDGDAGTLSASPQNYSVTEGAGSAVNATFTVTRTGRDVPSGRIAIDYATVAHQASETSFVATSGTLTFDDGQKWATYMVEIPDDDLFVYPDEVVRTELSTPVYLSPEGPITIYPITTKEPTDSYLTIRDDGDAGSITFQLGAQDVPEVDQQEAVYTITVTRVGRSHPSGEVTVQFASDNGTAKAGEAYNAVGGTLTFGDGVTAQELLVTVLHDDVFQYPDENFTLALSDLRYKDEEVYSLRLGSFQQVALTILDDGDAGTLRLQNTSLEQVEVNGSSIAHVVTVTRVGRAVPSGEITLQYSATSVTATSGEDFTLAPGVLTFPDGGPAMQTFAVTIEHDDEYNYPDETFTMQLQDVQYLGEPVWSLNLDPAANETTLTIRDDGDGGTIALSPQQFEIMEGNGESVLQTLTVTRKGRAHPSQRFVVFYGSRSGTAVAGGDAAAGLDDYSPTQGNITFEDGDTEHTFVVTVLDDTYYEYPDEAFYLLVEDFRYLDANGELPPRDYSMRIDTAHNNATITVLDDGDAGTVEFLTTHASVAEAGTSDGDPTASTTVVLTLTRTGRERPSQRITVGYTTGDLTATAGDDYESTDASTQRAVLEDGVNRTTVSLTVLDDAQYVFPDEAFVVRLDDVRYQDLPDIASLHISDVNASTVTILDDGDAGTLRFQSTALEQMEGMGASVLHEVTVTRVGRDAGGSGEVRVNYQSRDGIAPAGVAYVATSGTLTFADGVSSQVFSVEVLDDVIYQRPDEEFFLDLLEVRYGSLTDAVWSLYIAETAETATLTIVDDGDAGTAAFSGRSFSIMEGGAAGGGLGDPVLQTLTVTRHGRESPSQLFTIQYTTVDGTGSAGSDYTYTTGNLTFEDGVASQAFTVEVLDDLRFDYPDEMFTVELDKYSYLGTHPMDASTRIDLDNHTTTVTILDDGDAGTLQFRLPADYEQEEIRDSLATIVVSVTRTNRETPSGEIFVSYRTVDGTAFGANDDFVADSAEITFGHAQTEGTFTVVVQDDDIFEYPHETFTVELFDIAYGTGGDRVVNVPSLHIGDPSSADITILDDGDAGVFLFEAGGYQVMEPNSTDMRPGNEETAVLNVAVTRERSDSATIVVYYETADRTSGPIATAGEDYAASSGSITFPEGTTLGQVSLTIKDDVEYRYPDEEFLVRITDLRYLDADGTEVEVESLTVGSPNVTTVTIQDDGDAGTIQFLIDGGYSFPESFPVVAGDDTRLTQGATSTDGGRDLLVTLTVTRVGIASQAVDEPPGGHEYESDIYQRDGRIRIRYSTAEVESGSGLSTATHGQDLVQQTEQPIVLEPGQTQAEVAINLMDDLFYDDQEVCEGGSTFVYTEDPGGEFFVVRLDDIVYQPEGGDSLAVDTVQLGDPSTATVTITDDGDLGTISFCVSRDDADKKKSVFECREGSGQLNAEVLDCETSSLVSCPDIPEGVKQFYKVNEEDRRGVFAVFRYGWSGLHHPVEVTVETSDPLGWVRVRCEHHCGPLITPRALSLTRTHALPPVASCPAGLL